MTNTPAREALYDSMAAYLLHALNSHKGSRDAWRQADPAALIVDLMTTVRAGLNPKLDEQGIEDGVAAARRHLADAKTRYFVEIENWRRPGTWFRAWNEGFESADEARKAAVEMLDASDTRRLVVENTTTEVIETL